MGRHGYGYIIRLPYPVSTGEEFPDVAQRSIDWKVAGGHEDILPVGVGNFGNALRNRPTELVRIPTEYGVYNVHVPRSDKPVAIKFIGRSD